MSSNDYAKYYIAQGQRQFNYFGNGEYICFNGGDTGYNNMIIRLIHVSAISGYSGYYEANGTFALTSYSSSSAGTVNYKLYKRAGC